LREKDLCDGDEDGASGCPAAVTVTCFSCKTEWECSDTDFPGPCPSCGRQYATVNRCSRCPLAELDYRRGHSEAGRLLESTLELDWDIKHLSVSDADLDEESALGLKILEQERDKWTAELSKRRVDEANMKAIHNRKLGR
jgi:predicted RNA-binding Zn-ribbon protein involved in translation (DUF1610 family)